MSLIGQLQPRDHRSARRVVSVLCAVGLAVTVVFLPFQTDGWTHPHPVLLILSGLALAGIALLGAGAWVFHEASRAAWALTPFLAVFAIAITDVATHDASVAAQIFFLFPVLYAGRMLPRWGAALVTAAAVLGEAVVVFHVLPPREALIDLGYVGAALVATAALLVRGAEAQAELMAELERRARTDPLTGLGSRRAFEEAASSALVTKPAPEGTALVLLDVDWFKSVNDQFGHPGGDDVLIQLARLLVRMARRGDVVCRMGGDELAVLLPGCTVDVARRRAEQIIAEVRTHGFVLSVGAIINISVSAGMAHSPTDAVDPETLYKAADAALYEAKRAGRDRVMTQSRSG